MCLETRDQLCLTLSHTSIAHVVASERQHCVDSLTDVAHMRKSPTKRGAEWSVEDSYTPHTNSGATSSAMSHMTPYTSVARDVVS